jgi:hypothetical protein
MDFDTRTLKIAVIPKGEKIFNNQVTQVEIVDEAAGEYVEVSQCSESYDGKIGICKYEWPAIRAAIDKMLEECRD